MIWGGVAKKADSVSCRPLNGSIEKGSLASGSGRPLCGRLYHLAGADAAGANLDPTRLALDGHTDGLQIRHPAALPPVVGVTDVISGRRPLATDGADACHMVLQVRGSGQPISIAGGEDWVNAGAMAGDWSSQDRVPGPSPVAIDHHLSIIDPTEGNACREL